MKVLYTSGRRAAKWEDGFLTGDELLVEKLKHVSAYAPMVKLTETGPWMLPGLTTHAEAVAAGIAAGYVTTGDTPVETDVPYGADDGPTVSPELESKKDSIKKHLAGTANDHDQSTHGRRGKLSGWSSIPDSWGKKVLMEAIRRDAEFEAWAIEFNKKVLNNPELIDHLDEVNPDSWQVHTNNELWRIHGYGMQATDLYDGKLAWEVDFGAPGGFHSEESKQDFFMRHLHRRVIHDMSRKRWHSPLPSGSDPYENPTWREDATNLMDSIKERLDESSIFVRIDSEVVSDISYEGALMNQSGTGTSNGAFNPDMRAGIEEILYGYDEAESWDNHWTPIYGYASPTPFGPGSGRVWGYGDIALELDPSYRPDTTVTLGDTLDHSGAKAGSGHGSVGLFATISDSQPFYGLSGHHPHMGPSPIDDPGIELLDGFIGSGRPSSTVGFDIPDDMTLAQWINQRKSLPYVEAQVHRAIDFNPTSIKSAHVEVGRLKSGPMSPQEAGQLVKEDYDQDHEDMWGGSTTYNPVWEIVATDIPVTVWYNGEKVAYADSLDDDDNIEWRAP